MIIIGEKINGSIPSVAEAIANRDADFIKQRAIAQAEANATFIDCCASVPEAVEVETLKWMIDCIQEVTDLPISVDSPSRGGSANVKGNTRMTAIRMVNPGIAAAMMPTSVPRNVHPRTDREKTAVSAPMNSIPPSVKKINCLENEGSKIHAISGKCRPCRFKIF